MKNLPDDELFKAIENRLRDYHEQPDDALWSRIAGEVSPQREPAWVFLSDRISDISSLALLFLLVFSRTGTISPSTAVGADSILDRMSRSVPGVSAPNRDPEEGMPDEVVSTPEDVPVIERSTFKITAGVEDNSNRNVESLEDALVPDQDVFPGVTNVEREEKTEQEEKNGVATERRAILPDSSQIALTEQDSSGIEQEDVTSTVRRRKRSRFTGYMSLTPSLSFQHVSPFADDEVIFQKLNSSGVLSTNRLGYGIEAGIQGRLASRFEYIAGLSFYYQSQRLKYTTLSDGHVTLEAGSDDRSYTVKPVTIEHSFRYEMLNIGVQAGFLYTLMERGLIHKAGVILNYQHGLNHGPADEKYKNSASGYFGYQLIYRIEYPLNPRLHFFLQPGYSRTFLVHERLEAPFKLKQSRAGIGLGLVYRF